jgi:hypothetical protein
MCSSCGDSFGSAASDGLTRAGIREHRAPPTCRDVGAEHLTPQGFRGRALPARARSDPALLPSPRDGRDAGQRPGDCTNLIIDDGHLQTVALGSIVAVTAGLDALRRRPIMRRQLVGLCSFLVHAATVVVTVGLRGRTRGHDDSETVRTGWQVYVRQRSDDHGSPVAAGEHHHPWRA